MLFKIKENYLLCFSSWIYLISPLQRRTVVTVLLLMHASFTTYQQLYSGALTYILTIFLKTMTWGCDPRIWGYEGYELGAFATHVTPKGGFAWQSPLTLRGKVHPSCPPSYYKSTFRKYAVCGDFFIWRQTRGWVISGMLITGVLPLCSQVRRACVAAERSIFYIEDE